MKYILKIIFLIILVVSINTTFSAGEKNKDLEKNNTGTGITLEKNKTIKELKQEVKINTSNIEKSDKELDNLQKELLVKKFFKLDLNLLEKNKLNKLIKNYREKKENLNNEIILKSKLLENTEDIKYQLLLNEKEFYGKLLNYIDKTKYQEYLNYIKKNIIIVNKKSQLESNTASKKVIIQNKVDNIKNKIEKQNKITENNTIKILNTKINKILIKLTNKEKFLNLPKEGKKKLFENLINKISKKLDILDKKEPKSQTQEILIKNKNKILENIRNFGENIIQ